jgi:hypothetical protein
MKKPILKTTRKEIYEYIRKNIGTYNREKQRAISEMIKNYSAIHNKVLIDEINILYKKLEEKNETIKQYKAKEELFQPVIKRDLILD